jgi:hypothetical protein
MPFGRKQQPAAYDPSVEAMLEVATGAIETAIDTMSGTPLADAVSDTLTETMGRATPSAMSNGTFAADASGKILVDPAVLLVLGLGVVLAFSLLVNFIIALYLVFGRKSAPRQAAPSPPQIQYVMGAPPTPSSEPSKAQTIRKNAMVVRTTESENGSFKNGERRSRAMYTSVMTMEEAALLHASRNSEVKAKQPREILEELKAGNARFWTGESMRPDLSLVERRALINGQAPKVMVLGCADSRVPIEIVFDQGLGTCAGSRHPLPLATYRSRYGLR